MNNELTTFIDKYVKELRDNSVALFLGAGFSKNAGYVDWKNLLKGIADELELDVEKEHDLVSLAQYCFNKNGNRSVINDAIYDEFSKNGTIDENHRLIANLPIFTYWTTNYDSLIEDALQESKRIVDVKYDNKQLSITKPHRDAVVYKMHGDKAHPDDTIIIKDDYEKYYSKHAQFITTLSGDLISKTFLFIGFSFSDPNIDYILSRIQVDYSGENKRQHYALMRKIKESDYTDKAEYEYAKRKYEFFVEDLKRYNIKALLIDEYEEITGVLREINRRLNYNNIFISGSAASYGNFSEIEATGFIKELSKSLIQKQYNIISGFGVGVGSAVISGALEEIYMKCNSINEDRLLLRPFPQGADFKKLWQKYREDMMSRAGISIFVFGNKLDKGEIVTADGVRTEFEIAVSKGNLIVPVGCTGYIAEELWNAIHGDMKSFYPQWDEKTESAFIKLNVKSDSATMVQNIINFIELARRK